MRHAGWTVSVLTDDVEALAALCAHNVDVLIFHAPAAVDVDAGQITAFREIYGFGRLPVMVLMGESDPDARCRWLDRGADDVVDWSASTAEMVSRVRALMRSKYLHDDLNESRRELAKSLERERQLLAELREHNEHLQALCTTDPLTHLANVRSFSEMLEHEFKIAKRYNQPISMLMIDVDHFKAINDQFGHPAGDFVLKELAVILKRSARESDVVARVGGEEFAVILPKTDAKKAQRFAERVRQEVSGRCFETFGQEIRITVSVGSASWPSNAEIADHQMLLYFADQALLHAKDTGRDRVVAVGKLDSGIRRRMRREYRRSRVLRTRDNMVPASASKVGWRETPISEGI
ncbi:MAG: GGDEF domain-containing protein [Planctomycetota bacterium]|jgi:diguanylate cyclase (GGDEF)-like protein